MTIQYNENHDLCNLNNVNEHVHNNYAIEFRYSTNASISIDEYFFSNGFDVDEVRYMAFNNTEIMLHFSAEVSRTHIML